MPPGLWTIPPGGPLSAAVVCRVRVRVVGRTGRRPDVRPGAWNEGGGHVGGVGGGGDPPVGWGPPEWGVLGPFACFPRRSPVPLPYVRRVRLRWRTRSEEH